VCSLASEVSGIPAIVKEPFCPACARGMKNFQSIPREEPQFADPNPDLSSPSLGKITNTLNDGRSFQFTLQIQF
jgi:hypothetical protein